MCIRDRIFAGRGGQQRPLPDGDGDNPSSIVDIFGSKATTIPRIQGCLLYTSRCV